jgi:hypothetical protein
VLARLLVFAFFVGNAGVVDDGFRVVGDSDLINEGAAKEGLGVGDGKLIDM